MKNLFGIAVISLATLVAAENQDPLHEFCKDRPPGLYCSPLSIHQKVECPSKEITTCKYFENYQEMCQERGKLKENGYKGGIARCVPYVPPGVVESFCAEQPRPGIYCLGDKQQNLRVKCPQGQIYKCSTNPGPDAKKCHQITKTFATCKVGGGGIVDICSSTLLPPVTLTVTDTVTETVPPETDTVTVTKPPTTETETVTDTQTTSKPPRTDTDIVTVTEPPVTKTVTKTQPPVIKTVTETETQVSVEFKTVTKIRRRTLTETFTDCAPVTSTLIIKTSEIQSPVVSSKTVVRTSTELNKETLTMLVVSTETGISRTTETYVRTSTPSAVTYTTTNIIVLPPVETIVSSIMTESCDTKTLTLTPSRPPVSSVDDLTTSPGGGIQTLTSTVTETTTSSEIRATTETIVRSTTATTNDGFSVLSESVTRSKSSDAPKPTNPPPVICDGNQQTKITTPEDSTEAYILTSVRTCESDARDMCKSLGGDLAYINSTTTHWELGMQLCEPVWYKNWEGDEYTSEGGCIALYPGGATAVPPGGCDAELLGLCSVPK